MKWKPGSIKEFPLNKKNGIWGLAPRISGLKIPRFGAGLAFFQNPGPRKEFPPPKKNGQNQDFVGFIMLFGVFSMKTLIFLRFFNVF